MTSVKFSLSADAFAAAALVATQAVGATWELKSGKYSKVSGALHETFDTLAVDPKESLDLNWTSNGKALILGDTDKAKSCYKPGGVANFLCLRGSQSKPGVLTVDLSPTAADYYGFRWGSIDFYNTVSFYNGNTLLLSLTGTQVVNGSGGATAGYFNVYAGSGESITRVVLESSRSSLESDNHAVRFMSQSLAPYAPLAQVPEPSTYAMLLAGLGLVGFAAMRKLD